MSLPSLIASGSFPFLGGPDMAFPFPLSDRRTIERHRSKTLKLPQSRCSCTSTISATSWEHEIILEDILPNSSVHNHPVCLAGQGRCPPEDCGGIESYKSLVHAHADPSNPYYKHARMLFGNRFNPHSFSKSRINGRLKTVDNADSLAEFCSYPS